MKRNLFAALSVAALALAGSATGALATPCPAISSCTVGSVTYTETGISSGNGLTFLASFDPGNQNPNNVAADVLAYLGAYGIFVDYLGRAGDSSTFVHGDNVSVTGSGNQTGTWSFSPGTTGDIGAYVAIHAGDSTIDNLFAINTPGLSGTWGTQNGHGLSNFDLFGIDPPATIPEPVTLSLFGAGLAGAAMLRRKKKAA